MDRSLKFNTRKNGRYWWFSATQPNYVPPVFDFLSESEWEIMDAWYVETEKRYPMGTGECNIPAMSLLMGFIMGNNMSRIVQCGHFIGFSTLLIGFMARRMRHKNALFSIDIDPSVTEFSQHWINTAGLQDYVRLVVSDSARSSLVSEAINYLGGKPHLMFIDSSHECNHTLAELRLWVPHLQPGGFCLLHDVSIYASGFDSRGNGGVKEAFSIFAKEGELQGLMINEFCGDHHFNDRTVYKDACGLGIIQIVS